MGSHQLPAAILVPDDKLDCFGYGGKFGPDRNGLAFFPDQYSHRGLIAPHWINLLAQRAAGIEPWPPVQQAHSEPERL